MLHRKWAALGAVWCAAVLAAATAGADVLDVIPQDCQAVVVVNDPGALAKTVGAILVKMGQAQDADEALAMLRKRVALVPGADSGFDETGSIAVVLMELPAPAAAPAPADGEQAEVQPMPPMLGAGPGGGLPPELASGKGLLRIIPVTDFQKYMTTLSAKQVEGVWEVPAVLAMATDPSVRHYCVNVGQYAVIGLDRAALLKVAAAPKLAAVVNAKQRAALTAPGVALHFRPETLAPILESELQGFLFGMMVGHMGGGMEGPAMPGPAPGPQPEPVPPTPAPTPTIEPFSLQKGEVPVDLIQLGEDGPAPAGPGAPGAQGGLEGFEDPDGPHLMPMMGSMLTPMMKGLAWITVAAQLDEVGLKLQVLIEVAPDAQGKDLLLWAARQQGGNLIQGVPAEGVFAAGGTTLTDFAGLVAALKKLEQSIPAPQIGAGVGLGMGMGVAPAPDPKQQAEERKQIEALMDEAVKSMQGVTGVSFGLTTPDLQAPQGVEVIRCQNAADTRTRMLQLLRKANAMETAEHVGSTTIEEAAVTIGGVQFDRIVSKTKVAEPEMVFPAPPPPAPGPAEGDGVERTSFQPAPPVVEDGQDGDQGPPPMPAVTREVTMTMLLGVADATHLVIGIGEDTKLVQATLDDLKNAAAGFAGQPNLAKVRGVLDKDRFFELLVVPSTLSQAIMKQAMGGMMMPPIGPATPPEPPADPQVQPEDMSFNQPGTDLEPVPGPQPGPPAGGGMGGMGPMVMVAMVMGPVQDPIAVAVTGSERTVKFELVVPRQLVDTLLQMLGAMQAMGRPPGPVPMPGTEFGPVPEGAVPGSPGAVEPPVSVN